MADNNMVRELVELRARVNRLQIALLDIRDSSLDSWSVSVARDVLNRDESTYGFADKVLKLSIAGLSTVDFLIQNETFLWWTKELRDEVEKLTPEEIEFLENFFNI